MVTVLVNRWNTCLQLEGIDTTMILAKNFYLTSAPDIATRPRNYKTKEETDNHESGFQFLGAVNSAHGRGF
jgi:hypothetical protein